MYICIQDYGPDDGGEDDDIVTMVRMAEVMIMSMVMTRIMTMVTVMMMMMVMMTMVT